MLLDRQRPRNLQFYAPLFDNDSILSYLSQDALLVIDESQNIESAVEDLEAEASELRKEQIERGELPHNFPRHISPGTSWRPG